MGQMDQRIDTMMEQLTERLGELLVNQNREQPNQHRIPNVGDQRNPFAEESDDEEEENYCEEQYYEQNLFFDTDDDEDEDTVIGDELIFDEEDEGDEEWNALL